MSKSKTLKKYLEPIIKRLENRLTKLDENIAERPHIEWLRCVNEMNDFVRNRCIKTKKDLKQYETKLDKYEKEIDYWELRSKNHLNNLNKWYDKKHELTTDLANLRSELFYLKMDIERQKKNKLDWEKVEQKQLQRHHLATVIQNSNKQSDEN